MLSTDIGQENSLRYYGWVVAGAGLIILTVESGVLLTFGVFFNPILKEFGWSRTELSGVFSVFMIVRVLSSLPLGYFADRFGVRPIVMMGAVLASGALFLTSTFEALWQLYLYYSLMFSVGTSCAYIPITSSVSKWFYRNRGLAMGVVVMGLGLGNLIMSPITGFMIESHGWRSSYSILGIILLFPLLISGLFLREPPAFQEKEGIEGSADRSMVFEGRRYYTLGRALSTRAFWFQGISWFFLSGALYSVLVHFVPYAIHSGLPPVRASAVLGMMAGASLLGRIMMGFISDRVGRKKSVTFASMLGALSLVGVMVSRNAFAFYLSCLVFGFSYGGWGAQMPAMTADHFGQREGGSILGGVFIIGGAGMAFGPWLAAYLIDIFGYISLFYMAIGASLLGAVVSLLIRAPMPLILDGVADLRRGHV